MLKFLIGLILGIALSMSWFIFSENIRESMPQYSFQVMNNNQEPISAIKSNLKITEDWHNTWWNIDPQNSTIESSSQNRFSYSIGRVLIPRSSEFIWPKIANLYLSKNWEEYSVNIEFQVPKNIVSRAYVCFLYDETSPKYDGKSCNTTSYILPENPNLTFPISGKNNQFEVRVPKNNDSSLYDENDYYVQDIIFAKSVY